MKIRRLVPFLFLALVLAWPIWNGNWGTVFLSVGVGLSLGVDASLLSYPTRLQRHLLQATQFAEPRATTLEEWSWLDRAAWDQAALAWREQGFEPRVMQVVGEKTQSSGVTVSQLWQHSEKDALAEMSQTWMPARKWPPTSVIYSFWGDAERLEDRARALRNLALPDAPIASPFPPNAPPAPPITGRLPVMAYTTHNRAAHWVYNLFIHPQLLATRLTGAAPDALWQTHLARRNLIAQQLEQEPLRSDLVSLVRAQGHVMRALWHEQFKRGFTLQMWRALRRGNRQNETWGELETAIEARLNALLP